MSHVNSTRLLQNKIRWKIMIHMLAIPQQVIQFLSHGKFALITLQPPFIFPLEVPNWHLQLSN